MVSCMRQAVGFIRFFAILAMIPTAYSAPRIPQALLDNSLIYCTSVSGFSFNPQKADVGTNMNVVTEQIYDKLFEFDAATNSLKPKLVESYQISEDGKVITLKLRRKVAFHATEWFTPTRPFNAEDVVFSLNRMIGNVEELPALDFNEDGQREAFHQNQYYAYQFKANLAHYPYFESIALKNKIERISAVNDYTVKIHLVSPDQSVLAHLASQYAVILSKEYALQLNADENLAQLDLLPVGTGVYQLSNYVQNEYVRLKPHPKYWAKKPILKIWWWMCPVMIRGVWQNI
ncbi:putative peptide ABC transporter substrate-binding protein [Actinobacillus pleuropneumoniae]|nr:putative peptide ABC transporter substrate-binding protein [Actinobacillus pleuropneumoniae]KIE91768.1 putative peptide ABC transporter substrate-binding protein [Actinobacillus pleuropneumoniae]KIE92058.1 putative peptide ABC transporter substrate-binding protein [Actinobacillus pleuropneumoniae]KIE97193.1 putative peptide ABC transporter substrate-binding protein [Actinobacillus pleuropneumoniae]KIE99095.1 putative peptide ABC transporter substrate-binding protein [Actinobacillus pleuropne